MSEFNLENLSDDELIARFNRDVGLKVWVSARGRWTAEFRSEVARRGWTYPSDWMSEQNLSFQNKIQLIDNKIVVTI